MLNLSLLRVVTMLIVVFYHAILGSKSIWDTSSCPIPWGTSAEVMKCFHMPIFVLLSGYLYEYQRLHGKYSNFCSYIKNKSLRIMLPYVFWSVVLIVLVGSPLLDILKGPAHLWFLLFIFEAYVSFRIFDKWFTKKRLWAYVLAMFLIFGLYKLQDVLSIGDLFGLDPYIKFMPFYIFGAILCKFGTLRNTALCAIVFFLSVGLFVFGFPQKESCYPVYYLSCFALSVSIFMLFKSINITSLPRIIIKLDVYSMGIYIIHDLIVFTRQLYLEPQTKDITGDYPYLYPIVLFLGVTILSYFIVSVAKRTTIGSKLLG